VTVLAATREAGVATRAETLVELRRLIVEYGVG
jgi:hypothetical protein